MGEPPVITRTLVDTLAWAGDGAAHLRGLMTRMGGDAFSAPSLLPGWSRAHVLSHVARNADAMINLLTWARTGVRTAAYLSAEQRDIDIDAGAQRAAVAIRDDVIASSDRLAKAARTMPKGAWSARVADMSGVEFPAVDIAWIRAREMWIHAVDLDVGASFTDLPAPMLAELLIDVSGELERRPGCPSLLLTATDRQRQWTIGDPASAQPVSGHSADLAGWLLGRSKGKQLSRAAGQRLPVLPRWL